MASTQTVDPQPRRGQPCPCGSEKLFEACCEPLLTRQRAAATPEELMRARFTAHVAHDFRFLHDTYRPTAGKPFVDDTEVPVMRWTRLVVHSSEAGRDAAQAFVDFSAYGLEGETEKVLHEKAEFHRVGGTWLYEREARLGPAPFKSTAPKVGRNEPCPCGSGKKYKHCCLAKA
jgi:SEC-C motif-containing protein